MPDDASRPAGGNLPEGFFAEIVEQALEAIVVNDPEGVIVYANPGAGRMVGHAPAELVGRNISEFITPESLARQPPPLSEVAEGQIVERREHELIRSDGSTVLVEAAGRMLPSGLVLAVLRDIAPHKRVEQQLAWSERRYRLLLEQAPLGIAICDASGRITYTNPANQALWGLSDEAVEWMRREYNVLTDPQAEQSGVAESFARVLAGEALTLPPQRYDPRENPISPAGARPRWVRMVVYPVKDDDGTVREAVAIHEDVTERREQRARERVLDQQLMRAKQLESIAVFAAGVAHDFNNLLTGIMGHAQLARHSLSDDAAAAESIGQIELAARRAADLCARLLTCAGRAELQMQRTDLAGLVDEVIRIVGAMLPPQIELRCDLPLDLPRIEVDPTQLRQVVMNLLINAADALRGRKAGSIELGASLLDHDGSPVEGLVGDPALEPGTYLCLQVADNGRGIATDTRERIFDPFFSTKKKGRGLGLPTVMGIIRAHRGALTLHSAADVGTRFGVLLPACPPPVAARATAPPGEHAILIVEDEEAIRTMAALALRQAGYQVLAADNGAKAIELLRQHQGEVTLVLLDLTMPTLSGCETATALLGIDPRLRIVATTGLSGVDPGRLGPAVSGVLTKPYDPDDLLAAVQKALQQN